METSRLEDAGSVIRMARAFTGMSQAEFAEALGRRLDRRIDRGSVSDWEKARNECGATVLLAAVDLSGKSLDILRKPAAVDALTERVQELEQPPPT